MANVYVKIRKSDMLALSMTSSASNPDSNNFIEVYTTDSNLPAFSTNDYRYNQNNSTFYDVGVKSIIVTPPVQIVKPSAFTSADGYRARLKGTHLSLDIEADSEEAINYTVTANRLLTGAEYHLSGGNFGDYVTFEVVHPQAGVLDCFCENWYVTAGSKTYELYPANIPAGIIIRVTYVNTGSQLAKFALNLFLHTAE